MGPHTPPGLINHPVKWCQDNSHISEFYEKDATKCLISACWKKGFTENGYTTSKQTSSERFIDNKVQLIPTKKLHVIHRFWH